MAVCLSVLLSGKKKSYSSLPSAPRDLRAKFGFCKIPDNRKAACEKKECVLCLLYLDVEADFPLTIENTTEP